MTSDGFCSIREGELIGYMEGIAIDVFGIY
jgi:hypothetical protein